MTTEIIRTATRAEGGITPDEKQRMESHAQKWIANAVRTDTVDRTALTAAIKDLYRTANKAEPIVVIVPSPLVMAFAGGFAAAIWHLRSAVVATSAATSEATDAATYAATDADTRSATHAATDEATDEATSAATHADTRSATHAATSAAMDAATREATYAATSEATSAATSAATSVATSAATSVATSAATDEATYAATDAQVFVKIANDLLGHNAQFGLECAAKWYRMYQGGNMWSAWDCYLTAGRDILGLRLPEHERFEAWERCAKNGGFRIMHEKFCMVSDFPCKLERDAENRPHCADGPSHEWRDGWKLYHWHGVRVTEQIIEAPHTLTVEQIDAETNAEVRRVMIDRYGPKRYVADSGAIIIHELPADHPIVGLRTAKLLRKEVPGDEPIIMVDLLNSTPEPDGSVKRYMMRVDPNQYGGKSATDAWAAASSTWRARNPDGSIGAPIFEDYRDYAPGFES